MAGMLFKSFIVVCSLLFISTNAIADYAHQKKILVNLINRIDANDCPNNEDYYQGIIDAVVCFKVRGMSSNTKKLQYLSQLFEAKKDLWIRNFILNTYPDELPHNHPYHLIEDYHFKSTKEENGGPLRNCLRCHWNLDQQANTTYNHTDEDQIVCKNCHDLETWIPIPITQTRCGHCHIAGLTLNVSSDQICTWGASRILLDIPGSQGPGGPNSIEEYFELYGADASPGGHPGDTIWHKFAWFACYYPVCNNDQLKYICNHELPPDLY